VAGAKTKSVNANRQYTGEESHTETTLLHITATPSVLCRITGFRQNTQLQSLSKSKGACRVSLNKKPTHATCFNSKLLLELKNLAWENNLEDAVKEQNASNCWAIAIKISCVIWPVLPSWQCSLSNNWYNKNTSTATYTRTNPGTARLKFESSFHSNLYRPSHWFGKCFISCYFLPSLEKVPQTTPYSICFKRKTTVYSLPLKKKKSTYL